MVADRRVGAGARQEGTCGEPRPSEFKEPVPSWEEGGGDQTPWQGPIRGHQPVGRDLRFYLFLGLSAGEGPTLMEAFRGAWSHVRDPAGRASGPT